MDMETKESSKGIGNRFEEQRLTLRIHRGRGSSGKRSYGSPHSNGSNSTATTGSASPSPSTRARKEKVQINVSRPSNENLAPTLLVVTPTSPSTHPSYAVHYSVNGKDSTATSLCRSGDTHLKVHRLGSSRRPSSRRSSSCDSTCERAPSPSPSGCEDGSAKRAMSKRMGRRNIKAQVKRFRMETKAAKTLAIIVGGFIFCWLPFFTMYLVRAFCQDCIHPLLFSTLFWLGYCNSAINPLIYALFSKDFRFAFKRIICKCFCTKRQRDSRRGSDGSQLQGRQFRSPSYNIQMQGNNSLGEDSDPGGETDSR